MGKRLKYLFNYFVYLPLFPLAIGYIFGIVYAYNSYCFLSIDEMFCFLGIFLLFLLLISVDVRVILAFALLLIGFGFGAWQYNLVNGSEHSEIVISNFGSKVEELKIVSDGQRTEYNMVYYAMSDGIEGKVLVKFERDVRLRYGDIITGEFLLEQPPEIDGFDYRFYLLTQGVYYISEVFDFEEAGYEDSIFARLSHSRVKFGNALRKVLPEPNASLAGGLIWGERASMPEDFSNNLSRTGTTHIIAVSGFNVSIIVLYVLKFAGTFHRKIVVALTVAVLVGFILFVGLDNLPAFRAGIMGFVVLLNKSIGRKTPFLSLISIAIVILLVLNPLALFTVSFQLSFAAMIGIIGFSERIEGVLNWCPKGIRGELATTISAIISTSPITIANFESFSLLALFVNMLILPIVPLLTLFSVVNLIAALISMQFGRLISYLTIPSMDYLIKIINFFGALDFASVNMPSLGIWPLIICYSFICVIIVELGFRKYVQAQNFF